MRPLALLLALPLLALTAAPAAAAAPGGPCGALSVEQRAVANRFMATLRPHDCCDKTLERCQTERPSRLTRRLANEVCRRVAKGERPEALADAFTRRAESMLGTGRAATFDRSALDFVGAPEAKVEIIAYACTRCPLCARWLPEIHRAVGPGGRLYGKARLALRVFPLSSHPGAKEGAIAFEAARGLGKFWPYALTVLGQFDAFSVERLFKIAGEVGLDAAAFKARYDAPATEEAVVQAKKEGLRNGVTGTPTPFINGREYTGDLDLDAFVDAVLEENDRVEGTLCKP